MKNVLMIMHARNLPDCMKSLRALNISKVWFKGYYEGQLEKELNEFVRDTKYDNYIIVSDDAVVGQECLDAVQDGLGLHEIVGGYCKSWPDSDESCISFNPVRMTGEGPDGPYPVVDDYDLATMQEIAGIDEEFFKVAFNGFGVLGARRDIWIEYPFRCYYSNPMGSASDHSWNYRIQKDGKYQMWCAKKGHIYTHGKT